MTLNHSKYFDLIEYKPHRRQQEYHTCEARFTVPVCGRRFGKSTMAGRKLEPELIEDPGMYWIVGPTYDLGEKEFRVVWDDMMIGLRLGHEPAVKRRYNKKQGDMFIEFPWGTRLEVRSADHPENLVGEALKGVIISEAAKHRADTFERYIRPALADYRGWATFPTTPEGQNWLYDVWKLGQDPNFPDYASWRFPSWDNPYLYPGGRTDPEILLLESTTTMEWFEQEIAADFTAFVGKIFAEFQEDKHIKDLQYNPAWKNYIAFDFGFVNPLAAIEFQIDPWDNIYIWREHYKKGWRLQQHIEFMKNRLQPEGYSIELGFGDAADPEAIEELCVSFAPTIGSPLAKDNWRDGIDLVKSFLQVREVGHDEYERPIEEPRMFVDRSCINTIREFNNYKTAQGTHGRNPRSPREIAQQVDDHAMDALRYGLVHIYRLGARNSLMDTEGGIAVETNDGGYITTNERY